MVVFTGLWLYGFILHPDVWWIGVSLFILVWLGIPYFFMPSHLVIDYDNDQIEIKSWGAWGYELKRRHGLSNAKAIQIVCDSGGDSGYTIRKYLVFTDGEEIELPEMKEIESILSRWFEQYFHFQLPVLKMGFSKGLLGEWWARKKKSQK
jgi:hypothetical protein